MDSVVHRQYSCGGSEELAIPSRLWARRIVVGVLGAVRSALSGSEQFGVPGVARRLAKFFSSLSPRPEARD